MRKLHLGRKYMHSLRAYIQDIYTGLVILAAALAIASLQLVLPVLA